MVMFQWSPERMHNVLTRGQYSTTDSGCCRLVRRSRKAKNRRINKGARAKVGHFRMVGGSLYLAAVHWNLGPNSIKHPLASDNYCALLSSLLSNPTCTCTYWTERQRDLNQGLELEREKLTCP